MADVVKREGGNPTMGQSPFAIARGQTFERTLFWNAGQPLLEALAEAGVLPAGSHGFRDFRLRQFGGPHQSLDAALDATATFLIDLGRGRERSSVPGALAGPVVRIPGGMMLPEAILVIDVLVLTMDGDRPGLTVGEIKTYPDRGGYTDGAELATARAQAGVYVHGLELVLAELGLTSRLTISTTGFLVLTRPGSNRPSVRATEDLKYQATRAQRGFERLRQIAATHGVNTAEETLIERIRAASVDYGESCISFCDRAQRCHAQALANGDGAALGEDVARFLGTVSLHRALELLDGALPANEAETDLARRIAEADRRGGRRR
jgi:hypothetical protein